MQLEAIASEYVPFATQLKHAVDCAGAYVPSTHATGASVAFAQANPAGHVVQAVALPKEYKPAPHATGSWLVTAQLKPAGQAEQLANPTANSPMKHGLDVKLKQEVEPEKEYRPNGQGTGAAEVETQKCTSGHKVHVVALPSV